MKSFFKIIIPTLFILTLISCKKDDVKNSEADLVGSWLITEVCALENGEAINCTPFSSFVCTNQPDDGDHLIFDSDGTFRDNFATCNGDGIYSCTDYDAGTWEISGSNLVIFIQQEYDCSSNEFNDVSETVSYPIVSCSDNEFTLKNESDPSEKIQVTFTRQ